MTGDTCADHSIVVRLRARCPGFRGQRIGMAAYRRTIIGSHNMPSRLHLGILRDIGTAVASDTARSQTGVGHLRGRPAYRIGMAGIALTGHRNMRRGLGQGIGKDKITVMAACTIANDIGRRRRVRHLGRTECNLVRVAG